MGWRKLGRGSNRWGELVGKLVCTEGLDPVLSLPEAVREKIGKTDGETVEVWLQPKNKRAFAENQNQMEASPMSPLLELKLILGLDRLAQSVWETLGFLIPRDYARWFFEALDSESRAHRVGETI
ncbi:MAG: hypothetical protein A2508_07070 [Candidatus Lambdaproteobacteria bacterium RIFOXYD12_FULL_49_8]|uniref:Uncharacterized protein n=1 Tax=Candidatus Lambdaproteobacteria bacterium RIFOXYD2_FULL_50_16 TaxID=1817772 RepID=A0A1F6GFZ6_9PROT|nr:MAG: hypothetical protein A2527_02890 [Candidatus Lambdaproteobacteria bacterium RIFOXYD2_FULL_50_16]OGG97433.1 MAG: hypothetical protein A2508_07070 [Candidatus Lambdaproteobacteria bacterium RIFOXYD12_FULL_49_8]